MPISASNTHCSFDLPALPQALPWDGKKPLCVGRGGVECRPLPLCELFWANLGEGGVFGLGVPGLPFQAPSPPKSTGPGPFPDQETGGAGREWVWAEPRGRAEEGWGPGCVHLPGWVKVEAEAQGLLEKPREGDPCPHGLPQGLGNEPLDTVPFPLCKASGALSRVSGRIKCLNA